VKTKDDGKNAQNKKITHDFLFFFEQGSKKMQPQKLAPKTEVGCGLQKYSTFSEKRAKTLTIFFFILLNIFGNFHETK
jgi:phosphatidylglycerophosphatase A